MSNKEFDKNIKDKFEKFNPQSPSNDWENFSKMLSQEEGFEDLGFDELVSKSFKDQKAKYNSLHWILLKNRLEKEANLRKEIYISKILESILALLLVFTFINLDLHLKLNDNRDTQEDYAHIGTINDGKVLHNITSNALSLKSAKTIPSSKNTVATYDSKEKSLSNEGSINTKKQLHKGIAVARLARHSSFVNRDHLEVEVVKKAMAIQSIRKKTKEVQNIQQVQTNLLDTYSMDDFYPNFYMKVPDKQKSEYAISASVNTNFSIVRSPRDYGFTVDPYRVYNMDFGGGLEFSSRNNNAELSAGLSYTKVSYSPLKLSEISGGFNESFVKNTLDKIEFDLVQVPLNVRYHFDNDKKTHFWAGVGMAMNMSFYSRYNIESVVVAPAPSAINEVDHSSFASERGNSRLDQKNFHPGLLEKGSFFDNMFISANVDVGLETELTENLSLNTSLGYYKALTALGLGPNNDVLDAMKVGLGVRYKI